MISPWYIGPPNASILPGVMRRVPYQHRVLEYAKPNKMIYEVEKRLKKYALEEQVLSPHPQCKAARTGPAQYDGIQEPYGDGA